MKFLVVVVQHCHTDMHIALAVYAMERPFLDHQSTGIGSNIKFKHCELTLQVKMTRTLKETQNKLIVALNS